MSELVINRMMATGHSGKESSAKTNGASHLACPERAEMQCQNQNQYRSCSRALRSHQQRSLEIALVEQIDLHNYSENGFGLETMKGKTRPVPKWNEVRMC